jgi:hypothetical protein
MIGGDDLPVAVRAYAACVTSGEPPTSTSSFPDYGRDP